jgi:hypothetical protein
VSEKTVDELSLVRESTTKTYRSYSVPDSSTPLQRAYSAGGVNLPPPPVPPLVTSSISSTTNNSVDVLRNSSGSMTSVSSSSRPISLEDDDADRKSSFWPFGRKSVDQGTIKSQAEQNISRSPKHFSFEEVSGANKKTPTTTDCRMQREGSQGSLASSIFRKDFWKTSQQRSPMISYNSDSNVLMQRKESSADTEYRQILNRNLNNSLPSTINSTPSSEIINFHWE